MNCFSIETDAIGVALIRFDVPGRVLNTLTAEVMEELGPLIDLIAGDEAIKGVVLASGKDNGFCAGADIGAQATNSGGTEGQASHAEFERAFRFSALCRKLERCGKPIAIALEGLALGGGLEFALACHYRVASRNPKLQIGLPETTIGLIPGGGGTQRTLRLVGIAKALPVLLEGKSMNADEAFELGLIHQVVEPGEAISTAHRWVLERGDAVQPWDKKDFKLPGGTPYGAGGPAIIGGSATVLKTYKGNYPAQENILKVVYEGAQLPIDAALRVETRYFLRTRRTTQAKAMIRTQFQSVQALRKGALRPSGFPTFQVKKAAVIGAGMMGAGIAYVQAVAGLDTILIDVDQQAAETGKTVSAKLLNKVVAAGRMTGAQAAEILARITPTTDYEQIRGSDIVIEAVFEDRAMKAEVTRKAEAFLSEGAVFGSNTSTLPITGLAEASGRRADFIGIHFFSPVDRMDLVEVISGEGTSRETLAKALDYVRKIRKTPIVVNDSRGFYTSRCFGTYWSEGVELMLEGVAPAIIDNVGRQTGMPRGPLELADDVGLDLLYKVRKQAKADLGDAFKVEGRDTVLPMIVEQRGRCGRKSRKGFYDYPADGSAKTLWPGLSDLVPVKRAESSPELIKEIRTRLLYRQALEAARCLDEGVLTDPRSGDVGAVLGWGFPRWTGGPLSLIDQVGVRDFVAACDKLEACCGPRFAAPRFLRKLSEKGSEIYAVTPASHAA